MEAKMEMIQTDAISAMMGNRVCARLTAISHTLVERTLFSPAYTHTYTRTHN